MWFLTILFKMTHSLLKIINLELIHILFDDVVSAGL